MKKLFLIIALTVGLSTTAQANDKREVCDRLSMMWPSLYSLNTQDSRINWWLYVKTSPEGKDIVQNFKSLGHDVWIATDRMVTAAETYIKVAIREGHSERKTVRTINQMCYSAI